MSSFTFMGREYPINEFLKDIVEMAGMLAKNARIIDPLPSGVDLSEAEQNATQSQIQAMTVLPNFARDDFWQSFSAHHIVQLTTSLRALSILTQRKAISTLIQILSLLPDPKSDPYFRRYLQNWEACRDVPNIVAASFVVGIDWMRPSGPGQICTLIIHCLFWADSTKGDDGKASIDKEVRDNLSEKLGLLIENERFSSIDRYQSVEIERLKGILGAIDAMPINHYLTSTHQSLIGQLDFCAGRDCDKMAGLTCSNCKTTRYCGRKHQLWHWKNGHKLRCFPPLF